MLKKFIFLWAPIIFWCSIIFFFSSRPTISTSEVFWWDFFLKKNAHLLEFFILYILVYRAINNGKKKMKENFRFFYPLIFLIFYAISDEYHQSFTPGREARVRDVIIDGLGGLIAIWYLKNLLPKGPKKLIYWLKGK